MINMVECVKLSDTEIYKAFTACFSDYMIKMEMEQDVFISRFFGCEGNSKEHSFAAYEDDKPVGICLGGIKTDEEIKTFRCGAMAVTTDVRGKGVAGTLMKMHIERAKELGCLQLFLEVIDGNDRAVAFYEKNGYEKVYNLIYRKMLSKDIKNFKSDKNVYDLAEEISFDEIKEFRRNDSSHLPWQCSFDYFSMLDTKYYGIKAEGRLCAAIAASNAKVYYLWTEKEYRNRGYATALVHMVINQLSPKELVFTYSNNHSAHTFSNKLNMGYLGVKQLEMYRLI